MILDKLLQFDPAGALGNTIIVAGVDSTNILDLSVARDLGQKNSRKLTIVFTVLTDLVAAGGAASLVIQLLGSADNATYKVLSQTDSGGIAKANLLAGTQLELPLPSYLANSAALLPRYLKCTYKAITNPFTGGTFECDLAVDPQQSSAAFSYPAGVNVAN